MCSRFPHHITTSLLEFVPFSSLRHNSTMAAGSHVGRSCLYRRSPIHFPCTLPQPHSIPRASIRLQLIQRRTFSHTRQQWRKEQHEEESFSKRLGKAWRKTKVEWKPIPVGLGIGFLG